jgi:hypothetical protein
MASTNLNTFNTNTFQARSAIVLGVVRFLLRGHGLQQPRREMGQREAPGAGIVEECRQAATGLKSKQFKNHFYLVTFNTIFCQFYEI